MVPWKSKTDKEGDITIPVSASIASVVSVIIIVALSYWTINGYQINDLILFKWKHLIFIFFVGMSVQMPVMLGKKFYCANNFTKKIL